MKEILLVKMGEIVLKGLNRRTFEDALIKNIKHSLYTLGKFEIKNSQSTLVISPCSDDIDFDMVEKQISKVFGIASYSRAVVAPKEISEIQKYTVDYLKEELSEVSTFKVEAKRSDKAFAYKSPKICELVGGYILDNVTNLSVDVHNPDKIVIVEVRDRATYIHTQAKKGAGGIPVGTGGKSAILMSGGIDSPVAAYMMAKRGVKLTAVHFASPPYTSQRAEDKVFTLIEKLRPYCGRIPMVTVPFTKIQEEIKNKCPEELFTIIMRRLMMRIADKIATNEDCLSLITGESLGQVASQTMAAIACTDMVSTKPVFRPLIGMDKDEIVTISRKIDTFETSILPFEDCCTVFTPKHPRTKPVAKYIEFAEQEVDFDALIDEAVENIKVRW